MQDNYIEENEDELMTEDGPEIEKESTSKTTQIGTKVSPATLKNIDAYMSEYGIEKKSTFLQECIDEKLSRINDIDEDPFDLSQAKDSVHTLTSSINKILDDIEVIGRQKIINSKTESSAINSSLEQQVSELNEELENDKKALTDMYAQLQKANEKLDSNKATLETNKQALEAMELIKKNYEKAQIEIEELNNKLVDFDQLKTDKAVADERITNLKEQCVKLETENEKERLAKENERKSKEEIQSNLQAQLNNANETIATLKATLEEMKKQENKKEQENKTKKENQENQEN